MATMTRMIVCVILSVLLTIAALFVSHGRVALRLRGVVSWSQADDSYQHRFERAIQGLNQEIENHPNDATAFFNRGEAYRDHGRYDQALSDLNQAIKLNPNHDRAFHSRGLLFHDIAQYERAIQDFDQAIKLNPSNSDTFAARGLSYFMKKEYDISVQNFDEAIKLDPRNANAFIHRGFAYEEKGQCDHATHDYNQAVQLDRNYTINMIDNRGSHYLSIEQYDRAIHYFDHAIRFNPEDVFAYQHRGEAKLKLGDTLGGNADITKGKQLYLAGQR